MKKSIKLTGKQARHLRGLGHSLKPILQLGKTGITEGFIKQVNTGLEAHELIKIKLLKSSPISKDVAGLEISEKTGASLAQSIGKTLIFYREKKEDPKIILPK